MGMKKILCAIIGLLFTIPSWGACYDYTSATGTVSQIGTPTPDNPIYPTFYKQGDMVLRKVGNIADTYDATTGKITRRVGEYTFTGRENISMQYNVYGITDIPYDMDKVIDASLCSHNKTYVNTVVTVDRTFDKFLFFTNVNMVGFGVNDTPSEITDTTTFKQWLAAQYAAGTPVKIYYPLETEVVEDWAATTYCPGCDGTVVNYTSATGTVSQNGTPTPTNPITPVFYTQDNMVLRKVGDYADTYDATTGKITRRVGVKVFDGSENWVVSSNYLSGMYNIVVDNLYALGQENNMSSPYSSHFARTTSWLTMAARQGKVMSYKFSSDAVIGLGYDAEANNLSGFKSWLQQQYNAGTPVTVWYPLATEVVEDWPSSYCQQAIKVASTKYVETQFSALNTALANAVATVNTVVTQTIAQAASIATLQSGKQTRPDETCPAGKKCLLVTDENNIPHWYEIVEPLLPAGYIQLQWIESTGTQYIDTGIKANASIVVDMGVLFSRIGSTSVALGTRNGTNTSDTNVFQFGINSNNTFFHRYGISTSDGTGVPVAQTLYDVHLENYKEIISNGQDTYTNTFEFNPDMDTGGTLYIFATNDISSSGRIFSMAGYITYLSISVDGVLVRDFVPAKNPDGKIGMYDTVNGVFYENEGTGEFIAGPVAE